jgi:hypothetical protein
MTTTKAPRRSQATNHNGKLDRPSIVKEIDLWMRENCPGDGVDRLATRPLNFALMALWVASRHTGLPAEADAAVNYKLFELINDHAAVINAINGICRIAMNARKQGKLHPHAPSPATQAAQTRKDRNGKARK